MRINPFRTLQGKFTIYLSVLIVATMYSLAYWNIKREKNLLQDAVVREGKALVESFAIACTNTMLYEEVGLVEEGGLLDNYISDLMQRKDLNIVYAMILNKKGQVVAHSSMTEVGNHYEDKNTVKAIASWDTLLQFPSDKLLDISTPLAISTKRWGTLRIGISLEDLQRKVSSFFLKYISYTSGIIFIAIMMITLLFSLITKPLKSIAKEMETISIEDKTPVPPKVRKDEIGILQKSFYRMLNRIKEDEKEKERTQRSLLFTEKMVAIGKLTSGVAHEINNPLGGILNCIYHFKKGIPTLERQKEYLDLMEDGIRGFKKRSRISWNMPEIPTWNDLVRISLL